MIILPGKIKITMLKSFWIVFCTVSLSIISLSLWYKLDSNTYLLILLMIPIAILPGYLIPNLIQGIYLFCNRIIRKIVREIRSLTLSIIYYVFYFSFRTGGNEIDQKDYLKVESAWELKRIKELSGYDTINEVAKDSSRPRAEFAPFIKWIIKSRNWSMLSVVPFVLILSFLTIHDEEQRIAESTYTLY